MNNWIKINSKRDPYGPVFVYKIIFTDPETGKNVRVDRFGNLDNDSDDFYHSESEALYALESFSEFIKENSDVDEFDVS